LRCGEGPEQVVEFSPGTLAWRMVDLSLAGARADTLVRIQIDLAHMFVPSKVGTGPDPRPLGVMIRAIEVVSNAAAEDLVRLAAGDSISLSSPDAEGMVRLAGFNGPDPDGRWTDSALATIDLKLAPESVEMGRLRLHLMPFVTEDKGQTLRLRCGEGPEQVVEFSPGTLAWRSVDLPLAGVQADGHAQIQLVVGQTFVPLKLGMSPDPRALGVMVQKIELLDHGGDDFLPLAAGNSINLSSSDIDHIVRLAGFSRPDPDGRWTDSTMATIDLKLAPESVEKGRLRLHMMPFVTEETGQTLRLRCGEGPEQVVEFSPGTLAWRIVDLPLAGVQADGHAQIQLVVGQTFVPLKLGMSPDPRALGVMVQKIELLDHGGDDFLPLAAGNSINLSSSDIDHIVRLAGFSRPDPDGRWTDSATADS